MAFKPKPIPPKLGAAVDLLYKSRQNRLEETKTIEAMKKYEAELKDYLIETLPKGEASGVAGKLARAQITTRKVPAVEDWETFFEFVAKNKAWELLHKRCNDAAIAERWDAGETVPGVGTFTVVNVSVTKLG